MARRTREIQTSNGGTATVTSEPTEQSWEQHAMESVPDPTERANTSEGPPVDTDPVHPVDSPPAPSLAAPDRMAAARAARAERGLTPEEFRIRYLVVVEARDDGAVTVLHEARSQRGAERWCENNRSLLRMVGRSPCILRARKVDASIW